jgi:WhiB family redox-sensing transcriptional regulator
MRESHPRNYTAVGGSIERPGSVAEGVGDQGRGAHHMTHISENMLQPADLEENWQDGANCLGVDPDLFFPERGASTREAKEVCRGCIVREQCLEFALQNGEKFGIWGGLSERERRRIRRQRAQAARSILGA